MADKVLYNLVLTMSPTSSLNLCTTFLLAFFHSLKHYKALHTSCFFCLDHSQTFHFRNGVNAHSFFRPQLSCYFLRDNFPGFYYMLSPKTIATLITYHCCNSTFIGGIIWLISVSLTKQYLFLCTYYHAEYMVGTEYILLCLPFVWMRRL